MRLWLFQGIPAFWTFPNRVFNRSSVGWHYKKWFVLESISSVHICNICSGAPCIRVDRFLEVQACDCAWGHCLHRNMDSSSLGKRSHCDANDGIIVWNSGFNRSLILHLYLCQSQYCTVSILRFHFFLFIFSLLYFTIENIIPSV